MEKIAGRGVDCAGVAHSERAAGANGDWLEVDCDLVAFWHLGPWQLGPRPSIAPDAQNRPAAVEKQARPLFAPQHQRFSAFV
jgi:hypothetical protein